MIEQVLLVISIVASIFVVLYLPAYGLWGWKGVYVVALIISGPRYARALCGGVIDCPRCGQTKLEYPAYRCLRCGWEGVWREWGGFLELKKVDFESKKRVEKEESNG